MAFGESDSVFACVFVCVLNKSYGEKSQTMISFHTQLSKLR